jgi:hypothetical protein
MLEKKLTASGAKAHQRNDTEHRLRPYSDWHRTLDRALLMLDVDYIEWRIIGGELVAVGVMEVTRVDQGREVTQGYLDAILHRYNERDIQSRAARKVAEALDTKAYIVLFREDCSEFWVYNLSETRGWYHTSPVGMERWLTRLGQRHRDRVTSPARNTTTGEGGV